jgi:hypothetical protein
VHHFVAALDLAQKSDFSAIVVLERPVWDGVHFAYLSEQEDLNGIQRLASSGSFAQPGKEADNEFDLRIGYVSRWRRGSAYPVIVSETAALLRRLRAVRETRAAFVVDAGGVGGPVVDLFKDERDIPAPIAITITGGQRPRQASATEWTVPKSDLIASTVRMLETGRLQWSKRLPHVELLEHELRSFQMKYSKAGNAMFEAESQRHDDIVIAVSLACWFAIQQKPVPDASLFKCGGVPAYRTFGYDQRPRSLREILGVDKIRWRV